jgi:ribonuclease VapC
MVVDSSALVELVLRGPECERIRAALMAADVVRMGAPTLAETAIVLRHKLGRDPSEELALFVRAFDVDVVSFTAAHAIEAHRAFAAWGRTRHAAALNFGDCLTYAVAVLSGEPLLYVGEDFRRTDLIGA